MAAVPFYIVIGDYQITGTNPTGLVPQPGSDGYYWTTYRNWPLIMQTVPTSGTAHSPFWDGSYSSGAGAWVKYHHTSAAHQLTPIVAGANGDNWFLPSTGFPVSGGNFGSTTLLMQLLKSKHATAPYFKLFKYGADAGFGGSDGFKATGTGFTAAMAELDKAVTAMGSDTPDYRAIVLDASVSDIVDENTSYYADLASCIAGIRSHIGDTDNEVPVFLVNHAPEILQTSKQITVGALTDVPVAQFVRGLNAAAAATLTNVYLVDMNGAKFSANDSTTYATEDTDPQWYSTEDVLQQGQKIYNALLAHEADTPDATPGSGIATYFLLGDSQAVGNLYPLHAILGGQESILGTSPGTVRSGQYVWNDVALSVQLYDVTANANTLGTSSNTYYGPEATFLKRLAEEHPDGVLLVKCALSGSSLTLEGVTAGAVNAWEESAGTIHDSLLIAWNRCKIDCITNLNRIPDVRGVAVMLGDNDTYDAASATAFSTKLSTWVETLRDSLATRTDGEELAFAFHKPPEHQDNGGTSVLGIASARASVRATITALAAADDRITAVSDADLELLRSDNIHYGGEATYEIGYRLADALIALESDEGETATTEEDVPSAAAAFTVEDGSGITSANAYCTVAFADTHHQLHGNPSAWSTSTTTEKQDAIRQATAYLDERCGSIWKGVQATEDQSLNWPRVGVLDETRYGYDSDEIPTSLMRAVSSIALRVRQGVALRPDVDVGDGGKSETSITVGPISVRDVYHGSASTAPEFPEVMQKIRGLLRAGGSRMLVGVTR